ncbi:MAG: gluconokinase [Paraglaciecola sp.]|jgi:gluconokinase
MELIPDVSIKLKKVKPKLVIVMGVSGCGKSAVGKQLARLLGYEFIEADDFHSVAAKQQMANGIPLTDAMREPWLRRLTQYVCQGTLVDSVLAYSGLRRQHRQLFRELGFTTLFIHLTTDLDTISQRMSLRAGHFMPESMLASQFSSMQLTEYEDDIISLDVSVDLQHIIEMAHAAVVLM